MKTLGWRACLWSVSSAHGAQGPCAGTKPCLCSRLSVLHPPARSVSQDVSHWVLSLMETSHPHSCCRDTVISWQGESYCRIFLRNRSGFFAPGCFPFWPLPLLHSSKQLDRCGLRKNVSWKADNKPAQIMTGVLSLTTSISQSKPCGELQR